MASRPRAGPERFPSGATRAMIDCQTFLAQYTDYRDGEMSWAEREEMDAHVDDCPSCAHYDDVVRRGTDVFRGLPELEVSDDFAERLRWRLYQADDELRRERRRASPAQAVGTLAIAAAVAATAWVPLMHPRPAVGRLPAIAASAPRESALLKRLMLRSLHQEGIGVTSRLAQIGVQVEEMPYHDVLFSRPGPLVGTLASSDAPAALADVQP